MIEFIRQSQLTIDKVEPFQEENLDLIWFAIGSRCTPVWCSMKNRDPKYLKGIPPIGMTIILDRHWASLKGKKYPKKIEDLLWFTHWPKIDLKRSKATNKDHKYFLEPRWNTNTSSINKRWVGAQKPLGKK